MEVHISDPEKREPPYRHISYTGMACHQGHQREKGLAGYREAILYLKELTEK